MLHDWCLHTRLQWWSNSFPGNTDAINTVSEQSCHFSSQARGCSLGKRWGFVTLYQFMFFKLPVFILLIYLESLFLPDELHWCARVCLIWQIHVQNMLIKWRAKYWQKTEQSTLWSESKQLLWLLPAVTTLKCTPPVGSLLNNWYWWCWKPVVFCSTL